MGVVDWRTPLHSRHRQPGQSSAGKRECLWEGSIPPALFESGCACGKGSLRGGFRAAHPRTMHRDRKGWPWESIGPAADTDRGGSCPCAWAIAPSGMRDHAGCGSAWEDFRWCRCNTCLSRARGRWEKRRWPGRVQRADWTDGMRRRTGRASWGAAGLLGCVWRRAVCRR